MGTKVSKTFERVKLQNPIVLDASRNLFNPVVKFQYDKGDPIEVKSHYLAFTVKKGQPFPGEILFRFELHNGERAKTAVLEIDNVKVD